MPFPPPSFTLEQAFPKDASGGTIWMIYGIYPSFIKARRVAKTRHRPCRIVVARVVWATAGAPL